jgi:hypothetical protein
MKKIFAFVIFTLAFFYSRAQYTIRFVVKEVAVKAQDDIYIVGNFNNWNPSDYKSKLKPFGGGRRIIVMDNIDTGHYEFKFTRGNWAKVEATANGSDIANRFVDVKGDTTVEITIAGWKDDFPEKPKPSTASSNVRVIDTAFFIPQLNRHRKIWIYLPASYNQTKNKSYPVLYMHDGQNLFNIKPQLLARNGAWTNVWIHSKPKQKKNASLWVSTTEMKNERMNIIRTTMKNLAKARANSTSIFLRKH